MRVIMKLIVAVVLILTGFVLGWLNYGWQPAESPKAGSDFNSEPTVEQIEALSSLTTLRVHVADAIVTEIAGKTGSIKAVLVVHGEVTLGVDLSKAKFESVDLKTRTAILVLPAPQVQSVSLDQEKTKVVALCENGLWTVVPGRGEVDAVAANLAYRVAEKVVAQAADDPDLIERSRHQAEEIFTAFFKAVNWTVQIRSCDAPVPPDERGPGRRALRLRHHRLDFFTYHKRKSAHCAAWPSACIRALASAFPAAAALRYHFTASFRSAAITSAIPNS